MGNRFLTERYLRHPYSHRRVFLVLNEEGYEPRKTRAYGLTGKRFLYRNMFQEKTTRIGNQNDERAAKKSVRQRAKRELRENQ